MIFQKVISFSAMVEGLFVFKFGIRVKHNCIRSLFEFRENSYFLFNVILRKNYLVMNWTLFFRMQFCFQNCSTIVYLFGRIFLRSPICVQFVKIDFQGVKASFWFDFANEGPESYCFRRRTITTDWFSNVILGGAKTSRSSSNWKMENINANCEGTRFSKRVLLFKIARWTFTEILEMAPVFNQLYTTSLMF